MTTNAEGFILDPDGGSPLNLGNGGTLRLVGLTMPPAPKRPEWASNADTDGQALVRNPLHDNRTGCQMQVRVYADDGDDAMASIGLLEAKLQEACLLGPDGGLPFSWTPSGASTALTGYMLYAEITDMPITYDDGWFAHKPVLTVPFTAAPFLEGPEVTGGSATGTTPLLTLEVDDVPGDVPAKSRLVVTDGATEARRWVEWGLESLYYDAADPSEVFIDSGSLVTSGFAGSSTALSGAYGGSAITASLFSQPLAICGTGELDHIGTFRLKARVWAASTAEYWRFTWQDGDGYWTSNDWAQPVAGSAFNELDLGLIDVTEAETGDQAWSGRFEAYTSTTGGELGAVDYVEIFPCEQYGRLEGAYSYLPGVATGHDDYLSASGTLNGRVAPTGGTWATSGATTDFSETTDPLDGTNKVESRATSVNEGTTTPRIALLGTVTYSDVEVGVDVHHASASSEKWSYAIVRYVDSSNYAFARMSVEGAEGFLEVGYLLAGTLVTPLIASSWRLPSGYTQVRLVIYASGRAIAWAIDETSGAVLASLELFDDVLKTGGTLASGKVGFGDGSLNTTVATRYYDNFYAATPAAENLIINSGRTLQIRSDSNLRASADGTRVGDLPSRGSRLFIPQSGTAGRSTRIAIRATREDPITTASRNDGDSLTIQAFYTPRYLAVPRG